MKLSWRATKAASTGWPGIRAARFWPQRPMIHKFSSGTLQSAICHGNHQKMITAARTSTLRPDTQGIFSACSSCLDLTTLQLLLGAWIAKFGCTEHHLTAPLSILVTQVVSRRLPHHQLRHTSGGVLVRMALSVNLTCASRITCRTLHPPRTHLLTSERQP